MLNLKDWISPFASTGFMNELFPQLEFIDDHHFVTKQNAVGVALEHHGFDAETLMEEKLESHLARVRTAFRGLDDSFRIYQYVIRLGGAQIVLPGDYPPGAARETVERRAEWMGRKSPGLHSVRIMYVILHETDAPKALLGIRTGSVARVLVNDLYRRCGILSGRVATLIEQLKDLIGLRLLDEHEAFAFFSFLASLDPSETRKLRHRRNLDCQIATAPIQQIYADFNVFRALDLQSSCAERIRVGDQDVEVISLLDWPRKTWPNVLGGLLKLECNFILCSEFKRLPGEEGKSLLRAKQRHAIGMQYLSDFKSFLQLVMARGNKEALLADTSSLSDVEELDELQGRMKREGEYLGEMSFTAVLFGMPAEELRRAANQIVKAMGEIEAPMLRESYNALPAFLAMQPGNAAFNFRRNPIPSANYVDMSFLCMPDQGSIMRAGREYLIPLETRDHTPHYLQGYSDKRWGILAIGAPGAGKSFFLNALIDHSQKYDPYTFVLDIGGSYRKLARKYGWAYSDLADVRTNPFALPPTKENLKFLPALFRMLMKDANLDAIQSDEVFKCARAMYRRPERSRRLSRFAEALPLELGSYLTQWISEGQFGSYFDNVEDSIAVSESHVFDFQGLTSDTYEPVIAPMLFTVIQRILQVVHDRDTLARPKYLWCDEMWEFLATETGRQFLLSAGLTWRKHNGGIVLATQSTSSLEDAGVLNIVNELCPVKLLFPNPDADLEALAGTFHLSRKEVELFSGLTPAKEVLLKTSTLSKVLVFNADPQAYAEYANEISLLQEGARNETVLARAV